MNTETDLSAVLSAAYEDMQQPAAEAKETKEQPEQESTGPTRDEKGRFKSAAEGAQEEAAVEIPAEAKAEENTDQGSETTTEPAAAQPLSPPERWSAEWKAKFAALPREAQEVMLAREGETDKAFTQKTQEIANQKRQYEALNQVIEPRRQALVQEYGSELNGINTLFQLSDYASRDPAGFIKWFSQQRGIDISTLAQQPAGQETGQPPQAQPGQLPPELAPFLNKLQSLEQIITTQREAEINREVEVFKAAPGHEHFEDVRSKMSSLLASGVAADMQDAYDQACWASPQVREKMLAAERASQEAERKAQEAKRAEEAKLAAEKARKAAGTQISTKSSLNGGNPPATNWVEGLALEYERINGAV